VSWKPALTALLVFDSVMVYDWLAVIVSGTPVMSTVPVKVPPEWQPEAPQVVSPGAPVRATGGLLGLR